MTRNILSGIVINLLFAYCLGCVFHCPPSPVHGNWGSWQTVNNPDACGCSGTITYRVRHCDSPSPRNGGFDCQGHSSEQEDCNECACGNGGCEQICKNYYNGYYCSCYNGYEKVNHDKCRKVECKTSDWPTPSNGKKTTSECQDGKTVSQNKACFIVCNDGYSLVGSSFSRCVSHKTWSPSTAPSCKVTTCPSIQQQDHLDISPPQCTSNPPKGTVCTVSCNMGFSLMRYSKPSHTTTCSKGTWTDGGTFHCRDFQKPKFTSCPTEDIRVFADDMKTKAVVSWSPVKVKDNDGLVPKLTVYPDFIPSTATSLEFSEGKHSIIYTATDSSGNTAQCSFYIVVKVIRCHQLIPPINGRTIPSLCPTLLGSKCSYECNDGFNITTSISKRICTRDGDNGKWTGDDATCKRVTCPTIPIPTHGKRTGLGCSDAHPTYQTLCIFECLTGYKVVAGNEKRICKADGQWTGDELHCQIVTCPVLSSLSEGLSISNPTCVNNISQYRDVCRYSCAKGYLLLGTTTKTCSATGQWSPGGNAYCKDISYPTFHYCPGDIKVQADKRSQSVRVNWTVPNATDNSPHQPTVVHRGKQPGDSFFAGHHTVQYTATDRAANRRHCLFQIIVEVVKCSMLSAPISGSISCSFENIYGSQCKFVCNAGYTLLGSETRTCEKNGNDVQGQWTGNTTHCKAITCPVLDHPQHGYKSGCLSNSFGEKCLFYCNRGYTSVSGSSSRTCLKNSSWTGYQLICKAVNCTALTPSSPNLTILPTICSTNPTYQTTCQYLCPAGYRVNGLSIKTCLATGQWNHRGNVTCQDIERPKFTAQCPYNIDVFAPEKKKHAKVSIPIMNATDNSGQLPTVHVTGSRNNYSAGRHDIKITATDLSGNTRTCQFHVNVKILRCFTHPAYISNGQVGGNCDNIWGSNCHFKCNEGYNMTGSSSRTCKVIPGQLQGYWSGTMPFCTINRCRPLNKQDNGYVYPPMCSSSQGPVSGTSCLFGCYNGFQQSSGITTITCGKDTHWDKNISYIITCKDQSPPYFKSSCPSDIRVSLGHDGLSLANWTVPVAEDNSRVLPKITVGPIDAIPPFTVNKTTDVTYTATDIAGNAAKCKFRIVVEDNLGPRTAYCPGNITKEATRLAEVVTWKNPEFVDNSGTKITAQCNRQSGEQFYWGIWNIHCRGYDNNPNNPPAICSFIVKVSPKPCNPLNTPKNGAKSCAAWALGLVCMPMCNDKYDFPRRLADGASWTCGSNGQWFPNTGLPDCSALYTPGTARKAGEIYYFSGSCHNTTVLLQIKEKFIEFILKHPHLKELCTDPNIKNRCNVSNVDVTCGMSLSNVQDPGFSTATRKRRSPGSLLRISFNLTVAVVNGSQHQSKEQILSEVENAEQILQNITKEITEMVNNGSLILHLTTDDILRPVNGSTSFAKTSLTCKIGQVLNDQKCVSCAVGTYYNTTLGDCFQCPKETYQDTEGQTTCAPCPAGTSTIKEQTKNSTDCLAFCQPGFSSPTGLEPCTHCSKGFYQPRYGQKYCFNCSGNSTTEKEGSVSASNCSAPCETGSFSLNGLRPCIPCNRSSYQPKSESKSCVPCPGTTITAKEGSVNAFDCIEINECLSNPCQSGSTCVDLIGDYDCICQKGFTGKQCNINIDDCASSPCQNNATCRDLVSSFQCKCTSGFKGSLCEVNINECNGSPCLNNATCHDLIGRYECFCKPGYEGVRCEKETDECQPNPCANGGTCYDKVNAFSCQCLLGFRGPTCKENIDDCFSNSCRNNGLCVDGINNYSCNCELGYTGHTCDKDINECASSPCKNNATCFNQVGDFDCVCVNGYNGSLCEYEIDYCLSTPCQHGGTCKNQDGSFSCECPSGYHGDQCEQDIDECASLPCTNNGTCINIAGSFKCKCIPGLTGQSCEVDIDECLPSPCFNNATCYNLISTYRCKCLDGFTGPKCKINIDECVGNLCNNGATCHDLVNSYNCSCKEGFTGDYCQTAIDHCKENPCENNGQCINLLTDFKCLCTKGFVGKNCSDNINECLTNPCKNGQCEDLDGGYRCSCNSGFTGVNCTVNVDDCVDNSCQSNSTCVDSNNTYYCVCNKGYTGRFCEVSNGPCESRPCFNSGKCTEKENQTFNCSCQSGFSGKNCEINVDDCKPNPCKHNGICTDLISNYTCTCPEGFWGETCENFTDYCASANCSNHNNCTNLATGFRCNCTNDYYGPTCQIRVKKCDSISCKNGGTCHERSSGFNCSCKEGFAGKFCQLNIDDCKEHRCLNNATCIDLVNDYYCVCHDGFSGSYCENQLHSCQESPCKNNGTCEDVFGGYRCHCLERFNGTTCNIDKSPCAINPCLHGGNCSYVNLTAFTCTCPTGFTGKTCQENIDDCISSPCPMHSNCIDKVNGYKCVCVQSYTGENCETPLGDNFDLSFPKQTRSAMVYIPPSLSIMNLMQLSIAFWIKADVRYKPATVFTYRTLGKDSEILEISYTENKFRVLVQNDVLESQANVSDGQWHFIGMSWGRYDKDFSIYFDGKLAGRMVISSSGPPLKGGGEVVLGKRYSPQHKNYTDVDSFVGTLHQVNFWHIPSPGEKYMWNAAHSCSWPVEGNIYPWIAFMEGSKSDIQKKFPSTCKSLNVCKQNCSHYVKCHKTGNDMVCTCKKGFTGKLCDVNINDCGSNPCVNGKCIDDIASYRCECKSGYYGRHCEQKEIDDNKKCPPFGDLEKGKVIKDSYEGKHVVHLKCDETYSFKQNAVITYACGPQTGWLWNGKDKMQLPKCLSIAEPLEIRRLYSMIFPLDPAHCKTVEGYQQIQSSFKQSLLQSIKGTEQYGCFLHGPCEVSKFLIPKCILKRSARSSQHELDVAFELLFKEWGNSSSDSTVTGIAEAVAFHLNYAVTVGSFIVTVNGQTVKPRVSSFSLISKSFKCRKGYISGNDNGSCVACPIGTYEYQSDCSSCQHGQYQDKEGQTDCLKCAKGETTTRTGATSKDECTKKKENDDTHLVAIVIPIVLVILLAVLIFGWWWRKRLKKDREQNNEPRPNGQQMEQVNPINEQGEHILYDAIPENDIQYAIQESPQKNSNNVASYDKGGELAVFFNNQSSKIMFKNSAQYNKNWATASENSLITTENNMEGIQRNLNIGCDNDGFELDIVNGEYAA